MIFDTIESGTLVSVIVVLVALEAVALVLLRNVLGLGPGLTRVAFNLAAGASLMLALRAALLDQGPAWIALFLTGALVAHVADLITRWRET
jgi:hypothetical protein